MYEVRPNGGVLHDFTFHFANGAKENHRSYNLIWAWKKAKARAHVLGTTTSEVTEGRFYASDPNAS